MADNLLRLRCFLAGKHLRRASVSINHRFVNDQIAYHQTVTPRTAAPPTEPPIAALVPTPAHLVSYAHVAQSIELFGSPVPILPPLPLGLSPEVADETAESVVAVTVAADVVLGKIVVGLEVQRVLPKISVLVVWLLVEALLIVPATVRVAD